MTEQGEYHALPYHIRSRRGAPPAGYPPFSLDKTVPCP